MDKRSKGGTVDWIGSSLDDLKSFPTEANEALGFDLWQVQRGESPRSAKALKGKNLMAIHIEPFI